MTWQPISSDQVKHFPNQRRRPEPESRGDAALRERGFRRIGERSADLDDTTTTNGNPDK